MKFNIYKSKDVRLDCYLMPKILAAKGVKMCIVSVLSSWVVAQDLVPKSMWHDIKCEAWIVENIS